MSSKPEVLPQRLFFALWPTDEVRQGITQATDALIPENARKLPAANLHMTLAFIGSADSNTRQRMEQAVATVKAEPFSLGLGKLGYWPRQRLLWLGIEVTPPALGQLVEQLSAVLAPCGYRSQHKSYRPHITLARKVDRSSAIDSIDIVSWFARDFCLVESITGPKQAIYRVLKRWPLGRPPG